MKINSIYINNFKSLIKFKLELENFNCLIGLNGSGKSTILQAIDFLSQLMKGQIIQWLDTRHWKISDLKFNLIEKQTKQINFEIVFTLDNDEKIVWNGMFSENIKRCTNENITHVFSNGEQEIDILRVRKNQYSLDSEQWVNIDFKYTGSLLSQLNEKIINKNEYLKNIKEYMMNIKSLDLLSPYALKEKSRINEDIGLGGEHFPSFLNKLKKLMPDDYNSLNTLKEFYPQIMDVEIKGQKGGVKRLILTENCGNKGNIIFEAIHESDGILRILAILAQIKANRSIVLLDEIENGINPELIEKLVNYLINCGTQIIITTHSPMILNYIPMDIAENSILLLYKKNGETKVKNFLSLDSVIFKKGILGPGEIYVDTDITKIVNDLVKEPGEEKIQ